MGLYAILTADLDAFTETLGVRYDNVTFGLGFSSGGLRTSSVLVVGIVTTLTGKLWEPSLHPVHGPFGVVAVTECLPEVVHFHLELKWAMDKVITAYQWGNNNANNQDTTGSEPTTTEAMIKGHIVIPYTQGLCESIKKIYSIYGLQTHLRDNRTIKNILVFAVRRDRIKSGRT